MLHSQAVTSPNGPDGHLTKHYIKCTLCTCRTPFVKVLERYGHGNIASSVSAPIANHLRTFETLTYSSIFHIVERFGWYLLYLGLQAIPCYAIIAAPLQRPNLGITSIPCIKLQTRRPCTLDGRWVKHNTNRCAEGFGGKICSELCSYYPRVAFDILVADFMFHHFHLPCGLVIFPQITRIFDPLTSLCAR